MNKKGRPEGSNSFVAIDINTLTQLVNGGEVAVSKKFLTCIGVDPSKFRALHTRDLNKLAKKNDEPKVEMKLS